MNSEIADLQRQLESGEFHVKSKPERTLSKEMEQLEAEHDLLRRQVLAEVEMLKMDPSLRMALFATKTGRRLLLGSDIGMLLRQGMFITLNVRQWPTAIKALAKALPNTFSNKAMTKWEHEFATRKAPDGSFYAAKAKKAGLSTTDRVLNTEEIIFADILTSLPKQMDAIPGGGTARKIIEGTAGS